MTSKGKKQAGYFPFHRKNIFQGNQEVDKGEFFTEFELTNGKRITASEKHPFLTFSEIIDLSCNHQFSSVAQSCPTLCDPMNSSMPGLPVHHQLPEFTQTYLHWVGDGIQPSHPLLSPSPPAFYLSQNQVLFQWISSLHQVAKVLESQLQHQSFQWTPRTDLL